MLVRYRALVAAVVLLFESFGWYFSDTTYTIERLGSGVLDVGLTYSPAAEEGALLAGDIVYKALGVLDFFVLVGPK